VSRRWSSLPNDRPFLSGYQLLIGRQAVSQGLDFQQVHFLGHRFDCSETGRDEIKRQANRPASQPARKPEATTEVALSIDG
jgi:hypothetical protein